MPAPATDSPDVLHQLTRAVAGDRVVLAGLVDNAGALAVNIVAAAAILAATIWLSGRLSILARAAIGRVSRNHAPDPTLQAFAGSMTRYVVVTVGVIAVLQQLGVQATSVIAVLGAASLAIGLALQGALGNVAAGVMILLLRPYHVGDEVMINGKQGRVKALDLFSTRLADPENLEVFVPNGKVFGEIIVNYTTPGHRQFELTVGIDYEDDIDLGIALLQEIAEREPRILKKPRPWAHVTALAVSSVQLTLRAHTRIPDWNDTRADTLKAIKQTFEARGLSFPIPQQAASERNLEPAAPKAPRPSAEPRVMEKAGT